MSIPAPPASRGNGRRPSRWTSRIIPTGRRGVDDNGRIGQGASEACVSRDGRRARRHCGGANCRSGGRGADTGRDEMAIARRPGGFRHGAAQSRRRSGQAGPLHVASQIPQRNEDRASHASRLARGHDPVGTYATGYGEKFDPAALKILPAGSFYTEPANVPHYIEIEEEVVLQVSGTGPSGRKFVDRPEGPK